MTTPTTSTMVENKLDKVKNLARPTTNTIMVSSSITAVETLY
jgi:hypothetical protein